MAKRTAKKHRTALGEDPLDALVPAGNAKVAEPETEPKAVAKERMTVHLPLDLIDRVKNAVYWTPGMTLAGLTEKALAVAVDKLEKGRGEAYPRREAELKGGRPLK